MPKSLNSVDSRKARKRRRGESDDAYAKRIARLDAQRASRERSKQRKASSSEDHNSIDNPGHDVLERFLGEQAKHRREADAQIASLVKQLEAERAEKAALEARLSARNHVQGFDRTEKSSEMAYPHEIIDLSPESRQVAVDHEIIEEFHHTKHAPEIVPRIEDKPLNSEDLFQVVAPSESDPAYITLKGYICRAVNEAPSVGDFSSSEEAGEEKNFCGSLKPSLVEAAEMLLWVGWVERARQGFPSKVLVARFGEVERSMWRDAIRVSSLGDEYDLEARLEVVPFAPALTRTLSEALQAFPPATDLDRVVARCLVGVPRQRKSPKLRSLEGLDKCEAICSGYRVVQRELALGTLLVRGDA